MGEFWTMAGQQVLGAGVGMAMGAYNDARQMRQQRKLQALQIQGNKEMMDYSNQKQMEMWRDTNYSAQKAELMKAGLNPGLLYGMSGGGGTTAGNPQGNVAGGEAPRGGGEIQASMQMGMELSMMQAQKDLLESQANKNNVEADKLKGVDTAEAQQRISESVTRIENIKQGIQNQKAQEALTKVQTNIANLDQALKAETLEAAIDRIEYETRIAFRNLEIADQEAYIAKATRNDVIKSVAQEAINKTLMAAVLKSQNINIQADTKLKGEQALNLKMDTWLKNKEGGKIINDIMINWDKLGDEKQRTEIQKLMQQWTTDPNREAVNQAVNVIGTILGASILKGVVQPNSYERAYERAHGTKYPQTQH